MKIKRAYSVCLFLLTFTITAVSSRTQGADPVISWNSLALDAIRFSGTPPPVASRHLAILHASIFDAVNSLDGPYASYRYHGPPPSDAVPEAAIAAAAQAVLKAAYPQFAPVIDAEYQSQILPLPPGPSRDAGVAWGRSVASSILAERELDGSTLEVDFEPVGGPGHWVPTPPAFAPSLLPQWPSVRPFAMDRADQFRPPPPPALHTPGWVDEFNQVKALGALRSTVRTPEQTEIAWFWADGGGTQTPPGHWNSVAQELALSERLPRVESARLFALLNVATADACIAAWDAKYFYDWWRPVTAIREADTDGNPDTISDSEWQPLIITPPFSEHVSGHSTFSGAAATLLARFHGSDRFTFTLQSDGLFGVTRSFNSFSDAAAEAGMSRIYGGIHFMSANISGLATGRSIGNKVFDEQMVEASKARIRFRVRGKTLILQWPAGLILQESSSIADPVWTTLEFHGLLRAPMGNENRFYRLISP